MAEEKKEETPQEDNKEKNSNIDNDIKSLNKEETKESKKEVKKEKSPSEKKGFKLSKTKLMLLGIGLIVGFLIGFLIPGFGGAVSGSANRLVGTCGNDIANTAHEYILTNYLEGQGLGANVLSIERVGDLCEINLEITMDGEFLQPSQVYSTLDGKYLVLGQLIDMEEEITPITGQVTTEPSQEPQSEYSEEDLVKLIEFNECLAESNLVIYGAEWCGFCTSLVNMLGGYEAVESVYVECTIEKDLCEEKNITGYPTIKLDGERYQGQRTFEAFAEATGCEVPNFN